MIKLLFYLPLYIKKTKLDKDKTVDYANRR